MGCDDIDSSQDRLHSGDAAQVGPTGGKGSGASSRADNGREAASEGTGAGESGAEAD